MRRALEQAARRAAFGLAGLVFLLIGFAFLLAAAWLALEAMRDALFASLIVGLASAGLGAVLVAIAGRNPRPHTAAPRQDREQAARDAFGAAGLDVPPAGEFPPLAEAFIFGLTTALRLRRRQRPRRNRPRDPATDGRDEGGRDGEGQAR